MRIRDILATTAILAAMTAAMPASAQDVVMRRPIPLSRTVAGGTGWKSTPWIIYDGSGRQVNVGDACGDYVERRSVTCVKSDGTTVDDYFCSTVPKPAVEQNKRHDEGCTYAWSHGDWVDPGPSCSLTENQTRDVTCRRDTDHVVMDDSFCGAGKPDSTQQVEDFTTCSYSWKTGDYVDPGSSCSATEHQVRSVNCFRDLDQVQVDASKCDAATKPADGQDVRDVSACTYTWKTDPFVDPGASCTRAETQTRQVTCHSSLNDELADDAKCTAARPDTTQTVEDYSSCTFKAVDWSDYVPSSTCSAEATKTRTAKCQRSNDGGEIVDDAQCQKAGVALSETVPEANYSSCSNSWVATGFADPGANCGNETWTQSVACKRDLDGTVMPDASCTAAKPATTDVRYDTSSCGYAAVNWSAYTPSSTCSASATKTRTAQCRRSDGQIVDAGECTSRGTPVTETVAEANYSTCSNSWSQSGYVDPGASCGAETWTQTVTCQRDLDKQTMPDASCTAAKPSTTEGHTDYSGCAYTAVNPTTWTYDSTCSATATKTRTYDCRRGDGTIVAGSECTARGVAVSESVKEANYSTCSNSWVQSGYVDPGASCGNETWTQSVTCERDLDKQVMGDAACTAAKPATTQAHTDYSSCSYTAVNPGAWSPSSTCSASATKTRSYDCRRSDGTIVPTTECTSRSVAVTETVAEANYSTCSNSWSQSGFVDPGSNCGNETWTQSVTCRRDLDAAVQPDSSCTAAKPASSDVRYDTSSCGYSAVNWTAYTPSSTCSASATKTRTATCQRSDGQAVAASECTSRGVALTDTVSEANYSTCSNSWSQSGFVDPGSNCGNETWTQSVTCKRDLDGAVQPDTSCTAAKPSSTDVRYDTSSCTYSPSSSQTSACSSGQQSVSYSCTRSDGTQVAPSYCGYQAPTGTAACTSYAWYQGGFGGFGACQAPGTQTQTQTVYCQANNGGNLSQVSDSFCGGAKPAASNSQSCTFYTYRWVQGGFGDWNTHCGSAVKQQAVWCYRNPDNVMMDPDQSQCYNTVGSPPAWQQSAYVTDGCGYTANYGAYSTCSGGTQSRSIASCTRSDGAGVDVSECTNRGNAPSQSQSCVSSCTGPVNPIAPINQMNKICTGSVRYLSNQDGMDIYNHGVTWFIQNHPGTKCVGYVDMEPQGGGQSDSAGTVYVASDGGVATFGQTYKMDGYPYPAMSASVYNNSGISGDPGTWSYYVYGSCN